MEIKQITSALSIKVKEAWGQYFSQLISINKHNPRTLFSTINNLVNPHETPATASCPAESLTFLTFFIEKNKNH